MTKMTRLRKADLANASWRHTQDWLQRLCNHPILSHEETMELITQSQAGNRAAMDKIIRCNMRLVVSIAKHFTSHGMPLEDLVSEGSIGLMRGVEGFDVSLGYRLSTYGTWWIRQGISRAISDKARIVRIPVHFGELIHKIRRAEGKIYALTGREHPETAEILEQLGMENTETNFNNVNRLRGAVGKMAFSLNKEIDARNDITHQDALVDPCDGPESALERQDRIDMVCDALSTLTDRQREVVIKRTIDERTLEDISGDPGFGVTRERIRQIEAKALKKLQRILEREQTKE